MNISKKEVETNIRKDQRFSQEIRYEGITCKDRHAEDQNRYGWQTKILTSGSKNATEEISKSFLVTQIAKILWSLTTKPKTFLEC